MLLVLALAACGGGGTTAAPVPAASPAAAHVQVSHAPGSLAGFTGARGDAEVSSFAKGPEGWLARGTVTNPEAGTVDYRLCVSATDGATTRGLVQVDVAGVAAGESAGWEARFPLEDEELRLVLRVERAPAQD